MENPENLTQKEGGGKMIFCLHDSVSLLDCRLEGIRLPVIMCVGRGRGLEILGPAFF
jgi:hypothetical protein